MADTRAPYVGLIVLVIIQHLAERRLSDRHIRLAMMCGGGEVGAATYPWMILLHAAMLAGAPAEVACLDRRWLPLVHSAWITASAASLASLFVLRQRIALKDGAIRASHPPHPGHDNTHERSATK